MDFNVHPFSQNVPLIHRPHLRDTLGSPRCWARWRAASAAPQREPGRCRQDEKNHTITGNGISMGILMDFTMI